MSAHPPAAHTAAASSPHPADGRLPAPPPARARSLHVVPASAALPATLPATVSATLPATVGADLLVPTLTGERRYVNLDHAASTPALETVQAAVDRALQTYSSVHRGAGFASRVTSAWYEQARAEVGEFVGARADDTVVFTRSTTDSWNLLARVLPRRTVVFTFASEHHSTLLPWGRHRTVRLPVPSSTEDALDLSGLDIDPAVVRKLLTVDPDRWRRELPQLEEHYASLGDRVPDALRDQLKSLEKRLASNVRDREDVAVVLRLE